MTINRRILVAAALALAPASALAGQAAQSDFPNVPYATWADDEPQYRLYPGDEIDIVLPSAPELSKTVTIGPDGRIAAPLIGPQMAADRTAAQLEAALSQAYSSQLLRPDVEVVVRAQPLKIFVGGEVGKPGVYDMVGDTDALRAIIEAGGFLVTGRMNQVVIIRRGAHGQAMMRTVDLSRALRNPAGVDLAPLRRFDVVYVPRRGLAEVASYMQLMRSALPINFSYASGGAAIY